MVLLPEVLIPVEFERFLFGKNRYFVQNYCGLLLADLDCCFLLRFVKIRLKFLVIILSKNNFSFESIFFQKQRIIYSKNGAYLSGFFMQVF